MRMLVESLRRLYISGKLTIEQIQTRLEKGTINREEYDYIIGLGL